LAQGVPPRVVLASLGHSPIGLTADTYSHVAPEVQAAAAEQMDDLLRRLDDPAVSGAGGEDGGRDGGDTVADELADGEAGADRHRDDDPDSAE
jgi:hypothetical protein